LRDFAGASMGSLGSLFLQNVHGFNPKWTGFALSGIFAASAISNPLFGSLSDRGRKRWVSAALLVAAIMIALFPHVSARWTVPLFIVYGFFFMSSYPMTEAALIESVPDPVRGRVFGLFVMTGGVIGNLSHWAVGARVRHLGDSAHLVGAYVPIYGAMSVLLICSLAGLLCLEPIRRREGSTSKLAASDSPALLT
jgi:MFS family permease